MKELKQTIKDIFAKNNMPYDWNITNEGLIEVEIEWGDWKHDHLFLERIMRENGFTKYNHYVTEEDGDDAYSAIYWFKKEKN